MSSEFAGRARGLGPCAPSTFKPPGADAGAQQESARYRGFFQRAPVALWDEDFSAVIGMLDTLRRSGVTDLRGYFEANPALLSHAIDLVRLNDVNEFTVELFEADEKQGLLRSLANVFLPETEAMFLEELVTLWEGRRRFESETIMRTLKGRRLNVIFTVAYEGEECERTLVSIVDVTSRKQAEQEARALAAIVESSDDAIASSDLHGTITSWNRGAERLYGYTTREVIGRPVTTLIPADRQDEEDSILERIAAGEHVDHYETVRRHKDGTLIDVSLSVSPIKDADGRIIAAAKIARDITERKRAQERLKLLLHEIKHRIKNSLATVQAIVSQTLPGISQQQRDELEGRLHALARAHDLLTLEHWGEASVGDIVEHALAPFQTAHQTRFLVEGSNATLDSRKAVLLGLALHELATNAVKYGALSNNDGYVRLNWRVEGDADDRRLHLLWQESGGPPVIPPTHKGFGSVMIDRAISSEFGTSQWQFEPEGVVWRVELPLSSADPIVAADGFKEGT
jgi:PAS domain S-box-containing protein